MKKPVHLIAILYLAAAFLSTGCFNPPGATYTKTGFNLPDRDPADTIKKSASLGVSCPPAMKLGETRLITVFLQVGKSIPQIEEHVKSIVKAQNEWSTVNETTAIRAINLQVYDSVKVSLQYDKSDFEITPVYAAFSKNVKIDLKNGNEWLWSIKAISPTRRLCVVTVNIEPHTPGGITSEPIPPHRIPIKISLDTMELPRGWLRYLAQHPEYTVTVLLVPVLIIIIKRKFGKNKGTGKGKAKGKGKQQE
ncbi:MAG: hypothetical protein M3N14_01430 [Bacteroidota bacterium]|nr:hypothetical protein [Bacteroidota bacterium]